MSLRTDKPSLGRLDRVSYSRKETARLLGVSHSTVIRWERNGDIRVTRIGGRVLIPVGEIDRLLTLDVS